MFLDIILKLSQNLHFSLMWYLLELFPFVTSCLHVCGIVLKKVFSADIKLSYIILQFSANNIFFLFKQCWETYFGQQLYKLVLLDLIVETGIIFFMQVPRW